LKIADLALVDKKLFESLDPLLRIDSSDIHTYLKEASINDLINNTKTNVHCYFISLDGNKRVRVNDFARYLASKIVDFAIPRSEIKRAFDEARKNNSTQPILKLNSKARNLFTKLPKSGEGGEVLLSIMAENFLKLPQLFTKMVLKTNNEMHVHGSDGIHIGVNSENHLTLYWGESKLYKSATEAVKNCFMSISPYLLESGGSEAENDRDLQLFRDGVDLNDIEIEKALKKYLNPDDDFFNYLEHRGLCLVGFDSDKYPLKPNQIDMVKLKNSIKDVYNDRRNHIEKRIIVEKIDSFNIELFMVPFPDVEKFRTAFRQEIGVSNG
jgi:hypothetical protein